MLFNLIILKRTVLVLFFSNEKYLVHRKWKNVKFINAWRAGRKLGGSLIAYNFPKPTQRPDSAPSSVLRTRNTRPGVISIPPDANSATVTMQPPTSNAAANAEATSSALETNSPSNSDDQAMLGTAYAVGSVRAEI